MDDGCVLVVVERVRGVMVVIVTVIMMRTLVIGDADGVFVDGGDDDSVKEEYSDDYCKSDSDEDYKDDREEGVAAYIF